MVSRRSFTLSLLSVAGLSACAGYVPEQAPDEVAQLARGIKALNSSINPREAQRAARISVTYPRQLKKEYGVTDPPIVHNMKVNAGTRPRGLCWHWAEDMQRRLEQEQFQTLITHRAIANSHTRLLIDHSTVIVSARGDTMNEGMVLDPWRYGGVLYWAPTREDNKYTWVHRQEVFEMKLAQRYGAGDLPRDPSSEPLPDEV
ncbi:MAG: hypothetical protein AAF922_10300 [Pseudomonadota bacterium]